MKRWTPLVVLIVLLAAAGVYYYIIVDVQYNALEEFHDFPVPSEAVLDMERTNSKHYIWKKSTGTEVPLSYRIMLKKSGWQRIGGEGQIVFYEKGAHLIHVGFHREYLEIIKQID
ncbi:hypothetical protein [Lysinibacillus odysseyi]|uniref:Uncharacterized protein n=1 Tax=Lysinibacillus odysseyi 34hs-1 = NBRC 100172 TaxID=1220589 RepID=A0A0A3IH14_9BACI|nr:hypothetical protein [Lysinibacillus odysseyi]KGR82113.1 hypothetical protein CD32_22745 [Lysinibacillus odysseyi 34hs-1 = NBRC 100172]